MSNLHTTLLVVSCDDGTARDVLTAVDQTGATVSVYSGNALADLHRADSAMMREALFGRRKDDEALPCGHWHYWYRNGVQTIRCGMHHGWMTGHALLLALNGGARCDRAPVVPDSNLSQTGGAGESIR
jgi:hypothetical protein